MHNERINVEKNPYANKKKNFKSNRFEENKNSVENSTGGDFSDPKSSQKPYGNTYGRKGQANFYNLSTNDELKASMWETHGFIVDTKLSKLGRLLKENNVDCLIPDTNDSEKICSMALEKDRIFITSNLKLFNKKNSMNRCCVHYKDNPHK